MRQGKFIRTYSGVQFWPLDPRDDEIAPVDIAHSLSLLCRANGHFSHFYSVGQHSIACAVEAEARGYSLRVQLACLLHDGSEAYMGDVTRPVKSQMPQFLAAEAQLQNLIFEHFGLADLTATEQQQVADVDDAMLKHEMTHLMGDSSIGRGEVVLAHDLSFQLMTEVRERFLAKLAQLLS
ncbi:hypothetical protein [Ferrimonas senticii]|uniref:hypothetical protein n=1 Tax=Ferrimonas senticii TaxID=394566 RepID=UPI0003F535F1|nr:hypothetical protein [Ferrimonas senticii]